MLNLSCVLCLEDVNGVNDGQPSNGQNITVNCRDAGMTQWRERLPPIAVARDSRTRRHMWIEFVVGSRPCSKGFSPGSSVFLPPQKPTLQIPIRSGNEGHRFVSFAVSVTLTK